MRHDEAIRAAAEGLKDDTEYLWSHEPPHAIEEWRELAKRVVLVYLEARAEHTDSEPAGPAGECAACGAEWLLVEFKETP